MLEKNYCLVVVLLLALNAPCLAENQPSKGTDSHAQESKPTALSGDTRAEQSKIQSKLQSNLDSGKIDADHLAGYQARLDELREKEAELRTRGALTNSSLQELKEQLNGVESELDKDIKDGSQKP